MYATINIIRALCTYIHFLYFRKKKPGWFPHVAAELVDPAQEIALAIAKATNDLTSPILENSALGGRVSRLLTPKHYKNTLFVFRGLMETSEAVSPSTFLYNIYRFDRKYNARLNYVMHIKRSLYYVQIDSYTSTV